MEQIEAYQTTERDRETPANRSYIRTPALSISQSVGCSEADKGCCQNHNA